MRKDDRDLLEVLKFELLFLRKGGYGRLRSQGASWRAPLIFEDSPICMNYEAREDRVPCSECLLMQFVPAERQSEKIPCRHVPLDAAGQTLNALYAYGTQLEIEEALETWLKSTIHRLEQERSNADRASIQTLGDDGKAFLFHQWF
jgi:hypothetical protein